MSKCVMAIVAHPDDEVFGCGGALLKHSLAGDKVIIVTLTDGCSSRENISEADVSKRRSSIDNVANLLSADLVMHNFDDNQLDKEPLLNVVKVIESAVEKYLPERVYTHHYGDLNVDHRVCHQAVMTVCRPQPDCPIREVLTFEVSSSSEWNSPNLNNMFIPNYYIDITSVIEDKSRLIDFYKQELRGHPHARSKDSLLNKSKFRGAEVGLFEAEAYSLVRAIEI